MTDPVVEDYLQRLDVAARVLPDDRRHELLEEISAHIEEAGIPADRAGGVEVRSLLDRLGDPAEIVAAAREDEPATPPAPVRRRRPDSTVVEIGAVVMLTVGSAILVAGWLVGVILLWSSSRWRRSEKVIATLVVPGGPFFAFFVSAVLPTTTESCVDAPVPAGGAAPVNAAQICTHTGPPAWADLTFFTLWFLLPFVVGAVLLVRARRRAAGAASSAV
jgi:hypothetical protein